MLCVQQWKYVIYANVLFTSPHEENVEFWVNTYLMLLIDDRAAEHCDQTCRTRRRKRFTAVNSDRQ